jgi:hypothetical protein
VGCTARRKGSEEAFCRTGGALPVPDSDRLHADNVKISRLMPGLLVAVCPVQSRALRGEAASSWLFWKALII